jgi:phosphoglycolate phosphatase
MQTGFIDSIIFDLDGTLWDASASCTAAWNEALGQAGFQDFVLTEETIRSFSGLKIEDIFRSYFNFIPNERQADLLNLYKQKEAILMKNRGGVLYPGVPAVLGELKKTYRLFIVSNCLAGYIENFLGFTQLTDTFRDFECSGRTNLPKSRNIQLIIDRNNLVAPVYIGDTIWDHEASASIRIPFIYAAYGFGNVNDDSMRLNTFSELPELIHTQLVGAHI